MDMKTIDAYEEKYKYELPLIHKEFMSKYDGLSLDNGCTFYLLEELDAVNKELQVNIYQQIQLLSEMMVVAWSF